LSSRLFGAVDGAGEVQADAQRMLEDLETATGMPIAELAELTKK